MTTQTTSTKVGKLILHRDGHTGRPQFGEIYTAPAGEKGFVAGYRDHANLGLGLLSIERFATLAAAEQYLVDLGVY